MSSTLLTDKGTEALKTDRHQSFFSVICYPVKNNNLFWTSVSSSFKIKSPVLTFWLLNTASAFPISSRLGVSLGTFQSFSQLVKICLQCGSLGSIPGLGRSPGEGRGYLLWFSSLENSMDCTPWNSPCQNTEVGSLSLLSGDLHNPGIEPGSPSLQADSLPT